MPLPERLFPTGYPTTDPHAIEAIHGRYASVLVDIADVKEDSLALFTPREELHWRTLGPRRQRSFLAGRAALKRAAAAIAPVSWDLREIETLDEDGVRPCCVTKAPLLSNLYASISHDRLFAWAALAGFPIGIDIEAAATRLLEGTRFFLCEEERILCRDSALGELAAVTRAWTLKEALTKLLNTTLPRMWQEARVVILGKHYSQVRLGVDLFESRHEDVRGHVATLLIRCEG